ncbi:MAG TPA: N-acetylmuramoyl-L-alanine amidase, partial [Actinomycetota bacterium]|nr:N-acetylmuramoyl-L-alanine amidase [Actinomycetota bacterium]
MTAGRWTSIGLPVLVAACVLAACASTPGAVPSGSGAAHAPATIPSGSRSPAAPSPAPSPSPSPSDLPSPSPPAAAPTRRTPSAPSQPPPPPHSAAPALPAAGAGGPGTFGPTGSGVLNGKIIAIDPGHNGGNYSDPSYINHLIFNGREQEACDTTGTETDSGYTESEFNWNVAQALSAALRAAGATVVLTRTSNSGVGPCVTDRAAIGNNAHANAAVSIHADGGPPGGRGFAILEPVADGPNDAVIAASSAFGLDVRTSFLR